MKTVPEILNIINTKIDEHKKEVEACSGGLEALQKKEKALDNAMKHMVLKDKIIFHKACLLVLNDLKDAIK